MSETLETTQAAPETAATEAPAQEAPANNGSDLRAVIQAAYKESVGRDAPDRDERGRFTSAAPAQEQQATTEPAADPGPERPEGWSEGEWSGLSPEVRAAVARRESDLRAALKQYEQDASEVKTYRDAIQPYASRIAAHDLTPAEAIAQLFEWERGVREEPATAFRKLAQVVGFDLSTLAATGDQSQATSQFRDPRVDDLLRREAAKEERERASEQARLDAEIKAFREDARYPHFDAVRKAMGYLMASDPSLSLADAYDRAVWADPKLRGELTAAQRKAEDEARRKAEADKAAKAKAAAVGVRDSASSGANGHALDTSKMSLRDVIRAARAGELT